MTEGTGIAGLAGALTKELARDVSRVCHDDSGQLLQSGTSKGKGSSWGVVCNLLGGLRGPSKRGEAAVAMEAAWTWAALEGEETLRLPVRAWRKSGMAGGEERAKKGRKPRQRGSSVRERKGSRIGRERRLR